ncbi:MAG: hypothetical protein Tsb0016_13600 [Sphingomonadales bacterium]
MTSHRGGGWTWLILSVAALLLSACERERGVNPADAWKPNIILIAADALSPSLLSAYGGPVPTPHLDRLAREGVLFKRAYSAAAASGPARAALISGRYPQRFGFEFDHGPAQRAADQRLGLPVEVDTIGNWMQSSGYNSYAVGLWHLGGNTEYYPTRRGFHDFYGVLSGETSYLSPRAKDHRFAATAKHPMPPARPAHHQVVRGPASQPVLNDHVYLTDALGDAAADFVRANGDRPFFLYLAFNAPGEPLSVTDRYYQRFSHVADEKTRIYYAMIAAMDDAIGRVLKMVDSLQKSDNTLVIFTAITGCAAESGVCACQPLRGGRPSFFEGGVRVPLILRWPAAAPQGQTYDAMVSHLDIAPTLLMAAKPDLAVTRDSDGVDLLPYLTGVRKGEPHAALFFQSGLSRAVISGDWKYWRQSGGDTMLFNLQSDPNEQRNQVASHRDTVRDLDILIEKWRSGNAPPRWTMHSKTDYDMCGTSMHLTQ